MKPMRYDLVVSDLLEVGVADYLLSGLVAKCEDATEIAAQPDLFLDHFSNEWIDQRKYLVDWLILVRVSRRSIQPSIRKETPRSTEGDFAPRKYTQKVYAIAVA